MDVTRSPIFSCHGSRKMTIFRRHPSEKMTKLANKYDGDPGSLQIHCVPKRGSRIGLGRKGAVKMIGSKSDVARCLGRCNCGCHEQSDWGYLVRWRRRRWVAGLVGGSGVDSRSVVARSRLTSATSSLILSSIARGSVPAARVIGGSGTGRDFTSFGPA